MRLYIKILQFDCIILIYRITKKESDKRLFDVGTPFISQFYVAVHNSLFLNAAKVSQYLSGHGDVQLTNIFLLQSLDEIP